MRQVKQKGSAGTIAANCGTFFPNAGLQEFITSMTSSNKNSMVANYQTVSYHHFTHLEQYN